MAAQKVYSIQINGLTESVKAVDALNASLDALEKKIKALEDKSVSVGAKSSGGGSKSSSTSSLSEEAKLEKQIEQLEEKRIAHSKQIYQNYLAAKDVLKETEKDQKSIAATERLQANTYSNTIAGMKQELADIKSVMQTVDLGDTDQFDKMTQRAKELNDKLKEIEQSYGQFGRNVGNYANGVAEGLQKVSINVGGTVREFDNAKQAAKTLGNELKTMAVNGEQNTEKFKQLRQVVLELESTMKDAKQPMDALMDTMQSITAIASLGQGVRALFGIDDTEIQKSIKNLVALQNILKGIETINKQIQTREGIGAWIAPFNTQIDKATAKLLTFNTALLGTGKASKVAAAGINLMGKAIKGIFSLGLMLAIDLLIEGIMKVVEGFKKVDEAAEREKEVQKELAKTYGEASAKLTEYKAKVDNFSGSKKQEKKLVEELNKEFGETLGTYKSLSKWQDVLKKKGDAYIQTLVNQAKAQAALNEVTAAYMNLENVQQKIANGEYKSILKSRQQEKEAEARAVKEANDRIVKAEENLKNVVEENEEYIKKHGLGNYAPTIKSNGEKTAKAIDESEKDLINLRISNMKEGLNKVLKQLEEERKQRIAKVIADGKLVGERLTEIEKYYDKKVLDAKKEWAENVQKTYSNMWDNIYVYSLETQAKIASITYQGSEIGAQNIEFGRSVFFKNKQKESGDISSYGIQGTNQLSKGTQIELQVQEQNTKKLRDTYDARLDIIEKYWKERISFEMSASTANYNAQKALEDKAFEAEKRDITSRLDEQRAINSEWVTKRKQEIEVQAKDEKWSKEELDLELLNVDKEYQRVSTEAFNLYENNISAATVNHNQNLLKLAQDRLNSIRDLTAEYYRERLQELRDFQTAIANLEDKQPVYGKNWGIINLSETKKNNENLLESYRKLSDEIVNLKRKLQTQLDENEISFDDFQNANRELDAFAENVGKKMDEVKYELSLGAQIGSFVQSINQYVQTGLQSIQTVMNAFAEYEQFQFDKEQEMLDAENEMLQKKLDEQQEIIEEHKNNIESIEDELATSRGDRRQHLIDQLNAEMEAQKAAQKEEEKIQKKKEAAEKKQKDLDYRRKVAEWENNKSSILLSTAMATANGLATQPFWPVGVAMGALATTLGMVQYALAQKMKPQKYATGGVIEGKSHSQGGVKVLGGRAEVEGGEFITNRISTQMNAPLLEFINSKKKKIDVSDLIEFYSSGSVKRSIAKVKTKFEDGGYIPVLPNSLDIKEQLQDIVINQDNRPIYVSVVDINNKQEDVRRVQTLAGL